MIPANKPLSSAGLWGFLQLCLLAIGASGFPLWAHHPTPRESLALPLLLAGQMVFIALMFPSIAPTFWSLVINLLLMILMDELAGVLSNSPQPLICKSFICVSLWMSGLGALGWIIKDPQKQLAVAAMATLFLLGGVALDYLRSEAFALHGQAGFSAASLLPKLCNFAANKGGAPSCQCSWPLVIAIGFALVIHIRTRPTISSSTSLHNEKKRPE